MTLTITLKDPDEFAIERIKNMPLEKRLALDLVNKTERKASSNYIGLPLKIRWVAYKEKQKKNCVISVHEYYKGCLPDGMVFSTDNLDLPRESYSHQQGQIIISRNQDWATSLAIRKTSRGQKRPTEVKEIDLITESKSGYLNTGQALISAICELYNHLDYFIWEEDGKKNYMDIRILTEECFFLWDIRKAIEEGRGDNLFKKDYDCEKIAK